MKTESKIDRNLRIMAIMAKVGWACWLIVVICLCNMAFCGCAGIPPGSPGFNSCDAVAAGTYEELGRASTLTQTDVERGVKVTLDAATLTTDVNLHDQTENCRRLIGYRIYTVPEENFIYPYDGKTLVSGFTVCRYKYIVVGTPKVGGFRKSSLVHELFHALQACEAPPPNDNGTPSPGHENWVRDGIYNAIDWAEKQP